MRRYHDATERSRHAPAPACSVCGETVTPATASTNPAQDMGCIQAVGATVVVRFDREYLHTHATLLDAISVGSGCISPRRPC